MLIFCPLSKGESQREGFIIKKSYSDETLKNAKSLRKNMTNVEQSLWYHLRGKRFLGYKFKRQVPIGSYIVDFLCSDNKIIIELDGSGHFETKQKHYDKEREEYLIQKGYKIIRITNNEFRDIESVLEYIRINIENPSPQPSP